VLVEEDDEEDEEEEDGVEFEARRSGCMLELWALPGVAIANPSTRAKDRDTALKSLQVIEPHIFNDLVEGRLTGNANTPVAMNGDLSAQAFSH
jgi:hypothetical protein